MRIKTDTNAGYEQMSDIDFQDSTVYSLYKEKIWLESRIQLAGSDSMSLVVNIKDSLLQLELKGVVIKSVKMLNFKTDVYFTNPNALFYFPMLGSVSESILIESSIQKVPLIIKKAPKDPNEYNSQKSNPDSLLMDEDVNWTLYLNNGIVLKIEGLDNTKSTDYQRNKFWRKWELSKIKRDLSRTILFKLPDYQPSIHIVITETEAKALYRAIPLQPATYIKF